MPFVKLDTGIVDSSLWVEPAATCKCWVTMLAMADPAGLVRATAPGIAKRSHLTMKQTLKALDTFESPDAHSRSTNDEGRKIRRVDGGYQIINYDKYRKFDYTAAERMKRHRERVTRNGCNETVTLRKQKQSTEADKEEREKARPKAKCTQKEAEAFCLSIGLPASDGAAMFLHWEEKGWAKVKNWQLTIRKWQSFGYLPSQKQKKNGQAQSKVDYKRNYLPPARQPTNEEITKAREIAKRESEAFRLKMNGGDKRAIQENEVGSQA